MKLNTLLLGSAIALALAGCNGTPAPSDPKPPAATPAAGPTAPAPGETQAFYGDEAPVAIPAQPAEDHGHSHDGDADHGHGDEARHSHDDPTHSHDHDEHDGHDHDHGDGSEPHDH